MLTNDDGIDGSDINAIKLRPGFVLNDTPPHLIVSEVNFCLNIGLSVNHSGTVGRRYAGPKNTAESDFIRLLVKP